MNARYILVFLAGLFVIATSSPEAFAKNSNPSSGRRLKYDHWLTCDGAGGEAFRGSSLLSRSKINRDSSEQDVEKDVPQFEGAYNFQTEDTWEEWVTHSGNDCSHCGQTCTTSGSGDSKTESCSCDYCSWQELETFYRPWSTQTTHWKVDWASADDYNQKRRDWIAKGKPDIANNNSNVQALLNFDPGRPNKYFLFPGEVEQVKVSNDSGSEIRPAVSIGSPRNEYTINTNSNRHGLNQWHPERECDDVDLDVYSTVQTGQRKITDPPNSIIFTKDFLDQTKAATEKPDEPAGYKFVDISAMMYEDMNVFDNYKDTKVQIRLRQHNRFLWFDRWVSGPVLLNDTVSVVKFQQGADKDLPPLAEYELAASQLLRTQHTGKLFHLIPGKTYELCTRMQRKHNVYYKDKGFFGGDVWSDWNCSQFVYSEDGLDHRSFARKTKDWTYRWIFPTSLLSMLFDW